MRTYKFFYRAPAHHGRLAGAKRSIALSVQLCLCVVLAAYAVQTAAFTASNRGTAARALQQHMQQGSAAAGHDSYSSAQQAGDVSTASTDTPYTDPDNNPRTNPLRFAVQPQALPDKLPASSTSNARGTIVRNAHIQEADGTRKCATEATAADKEGRAREERRVARLIASGTGSRSSVRGAAAPIEVFFHILVYNNEGIVSRLQVQKQLDVLNEAFSDVRVRFILRQAFMYDLGSTEHGRRFFNARYGSQEEQIFKKAWRKGDASTLNIYTLNMSNGILGWSTFPWHYDSSRCDTCQLMDGVVLNMDAMPNGRQKKFNTGNTGVHEVGHWLGLFHTFEGGCDSNATAGGDLVADTPPQAVSASGCPARQDSCPDLQGLDAVNNYMDYADDACMNNFTPGQIKRMNVLWRLHRGQQ